MHVLVVDPEYLVAMEVERVLRESLVCDIHIAMPRDYAAELQVKNFDIVVADAGLARGADDNHPLRRTSARLVFTTLSQREIGGVEGWDGVPTITKPFDERQLLDTIKNTAQF